jgi:Tfp pilus assembly pilus retraction ATPase PilT
MAGMYRLDDLINLAASEGADEVHLQAGQPPVLVSRGQKRALDLPTLTGDNVVELFRSFATEAQVEELRRCGDVRFNHSFQNSLRFGVTASEQGENISLKMKHLGR